jgi:hypothetical protein
VPAPFSEGRCGETSERVTLEARRCALLSNQLDWQWWLWKRVEQSRDLPLSCFLLGSTLLACLWQLASPDVWPVPLSPWGAHPWDPGPA